MDFEFVPQIQEHKPKPISKQTYINRLQKALLHSLFDVEMITAKALKNDSFKSEFFVCELSMIDGIPTLRLTDLDKQYNEHVAKVRRKQTNREKAHEKRKTRKALAKEKDNALQLHKQTLINRSQSSEKLKEATIKRIIAQLPKPQTIPTKRSKTAKLIGEIVTIRKTISVTLEPIIINRQKRYVPIQFSESVVIEKRIQQDLKRIEKNYTFKINNGMLKNI